MKDMKEYVTFLLTQDLNKTIREVLSELFDKVQDVQDLTLKVNISAEENIINSIVEYLKVKKCTLSVSRITAALGICKKLTPKEVEEILVSQNDPRLVLNHRPHYNNTNLFLTEVSLKK